MEILFVTHKYPPSVGGMEQHCYHLVQRLQQQAKVHLIKPKEGQWKIWFYLTLFWRMYWTLKTNPAITHIYANDGIMGLFGSYFNASKYCKILTLHGLDVTFPNAYFQNTLIKRLYKFDKVICVSEGTKQECLQRGFAPEQLVAISNGVSHNIQDIEVDKAYIEKLVDRLQIDEDTHILVSSGRAVRRKGFSWFTTHVLPLLDLPVVYLIIGPIEEKDSSTRKWLNRLPQKVSHQIKLLFGYADDSQAIIELTERGDLPVHHLGKLPFKHMLSVISMADLYIMPNIEVQGDYEGFGLVSLEANLRNKLVIASKMQGIQQAISHGNNGILLHPESIEEWKHSIESELLDKTKLATKSNKAHEYVLQNYSWETMANEYFQIFEELSIEFGFAALAATCD